VGEYVYKSDGETVVVFISISSNILKTKKTKKTHPRETTDHQHLLASTYFSVLPSMGKDLCQVCNSIPNPKSLFYFQSL
jgi:hypothetical protein